MCDTFVSMSTGSKDKSVIFGKNSDRPQDEVQLITHIPRTRFSKSDMLKCTYISIPQVSETVEVILSQPWWMWGAEMGANEYDVVIGNEAVHTFEPLRNKGLLGMDLLRLGLERGKTAREAMFVITDLLEKYGQGGGCAYGDSSWTYHNSFLIADPRDAYVLETADNWWVAEKVKHTRSISNEISIRGKGDLRKKGIIDYAIDRGYCKNEEDFDFATTFSGAYISDRPSPFSRGGKSKLLLEKNKGDITPELMMEFLREHETGICMHGGFESTGSQVSHLVNKEENIIHWFTGTTLPCLSIYKPYNFSSDEFIYLKSGPYTNINPEWFWVKNSNYIRNLTSTQSFTSEIREYERKKIHEIDKIIRDNSQKDVNKLNKEMWDFNCHLFS